MIDPSILPYLIVAGIMTITLLVVSTPRETPTTDAPDEHWRVVTLLDECRKALANEALSRSERARLEAIERDLFDRWDAIRSEGL